MAQLFVTLLFVGIMVGAVRLITAELARPLANEPNCFDDWLVDQLALANRGMLRGMGDEAPFSVEASGKRLALT